MVFLFTSLEFNNIYALTEIVKMDCRRSVCLVNSSVWKTLCCYVSRNLLKDCCHYAFIWSLCSFRYAYRIRSWTYLCWTFTGFWSRKKKNMLLSNVTSSKITVRLVRSHYCGCYVHFLFKISVTVSIVRTNHNTWWPLHQWKTAFTYHLTISDHIL